MSLWILLFVILPTAEWQTNYMPEVTLQAESYASFFPFSSIRHYWGKMDLKEMMRIKKKKSIESTSRLFVGFNITSFVLHFIQNVLGWEYQGLLKRSDFPCLESEYDRYIIQECWDYLVQDIWQLECRTRRQLEPSTVHPGSISALILSRSPISQTRSLTPREVWWPDHDHLIS